MKFYLSLRKELIEENGKKVGIKKTYIRNFLNYIYEAQRDFAGGSVPL